MSYVLSVIHPPIAPAAHGKAVVMREEVIEIQHAADTAGDVLIRMDVPVLAARAFGNELAQLGTAALKVHQPTGFAFRIDQAETPPNACPCCGRLVAPEDAMFAGDKDTTCDGCYPYAREFAGPACLPRNTAHEEDPS